MSRMQHQTEFQYFSQLFEKRGAFAAMACYGTVAAQVKEIE